MQGYGARMDIRDISQIPQLDQYLAEHDMGGSWKREGPPRVEFKPYLWKWADLHEALLKVGETISMDKTGELAGRLAGRKNLGLRNPSLGNAGAKTITLGLQVLMPDEIAEAHRHSQAGLRFVIKGTPGAFMVVEGERFPMGDGDLITTPAWAWHDYCNEGDEPVYWLDGLDIPLTRLAHVFREVYPTPQQPITRTVGHSAKTLGLAQPQWLKSELRTPPFRYPWAETYATLTALKDAEVEPDPFDGYHLMYTHPVDGGPTTPTFAAELQLLSPSFTGQAHRHNSTTIYHVVRGGGATAIAEEPFEWSQGDIFVVPPWSWHEHENRGSDDAILFSVADWPTLQAFGFYREEVDRSR